MGLFLESMGFKLTDECLIIPEGTKDVHHNDIERTEFCNEGDKTLKFYVIDKPNDDFEKYVIWEEDRILIIYGNETQEQLDKKNKALLAGRGPEGVLIG